MPVRGWNQRFSAITTTTIKTTATAAIETTPTPAAEQHKRQHPTPAATNNDIKNNPGDRSPYLTAAKRVPGFDLFTIYILQVHIISSAWQCFFPLCIFEFNKRGSSIRLCPFTIYTFYVPGMGYSRGLAQYSVLRLVDVAAKSDKSSYLVTLMIVFGLAFGKSQL